MQDCKIARCKVFVKKQLFVLKMVNYVCFSEHRSNPPENSKETGGKKIKCTTGAGRCAFEVEEDDTLLQLRQADEDLAVVGGEVLLELLGAVGNELQEQAAQVGQEAG